MSYVGVEVVEVWAWDRFVGATTFDPGSGAYAWEYDPEWVRTGPELAPLHLPNRAGASVFPELNPATYYGLAPLLADALPDRFGNALIDAWMAARGIPRHAVTPLDRLVYTADRAMGALEFRPPVDVDTELPSAIELADLVATARRALSGELAEGDEARTSLEQLIAVGTSAGGARAKAVIAFNPETYQIRSGQHAAPEGFEHWLIKLDGVGTDPTREAALGGGLGYGIIEYAYHRMAVAAGIEMTECRLLPEGPRTHFLTRRFDRVGPTDKLHLASLCGLAHLDFNLAGANGYEQYLATIDQLGLGPDARAEAFRRIVFNVAAVNRDDHTKNLGFLATPTGEWKLAPAYDITFAYNPSGTWTAHHQMTVGGKVDGITRADLEHLADRFAIPGYRNELDHVLEAIDHWPDFATQSGVPPALASEIRTIHHRFRPA